MHASISLLPIHPLFAFHPPPLSMYVFLSLPPFTHSLYVIPPYLQIYISLFPPLHALSVCHSTSVCMPLSLYSLLITFLFLIPTPPPCICMYFSLYSPPHSLTLSFSFSAGMPISFYSPSFRLCLLNVCKYVFIILLSFLIFFAFTLFSLLPLPNHLSIKDKHIIHNAVHVKQNII